MRNVEGKWLPTVTETGIYGFFGEYRWLSNFHVCPVEFDGIVYPSSEHAYQAAKTMDEEVRQLFLQLDTPAKAKKFGQVIEIAPNWESIKDEVMAQISFNKYMNLDLRKLLVETGSKRLEETNYWGDTYWGKCRGEGHNKLGSILETVRTVYQTIG